MSEMLEIDQVHLSTVMLCMLKMEDKGHTDTFWLITSLILNEDFQSKKSFGKLRLRAFQPYHQILCILKHVRDVGDRSSTPKDCNAMYLKMSKIHQIHLRAVMLCMSEMSEIDQAHLRTVMLCMLKMSKIDQIHLRAVMLCMSKMLKMGKEHTDTFWLITSLILNGFSIRKKFWKAET